MININVVTRSGSRITVKAEPGRSLMETLRDGGIDDIAALCGGNCSCATCHVYVDDFDGLGARSDEETDILDSLLHQKPNSRLCCQIEVVDAMNDLEVKVAPEE